MRISFIKAFVSVLMVLVSVSSAVAADSTTVQLDFNDGPHVFWQDDTTAVVLYVCGDSLSRHTFHTTDTLSFSGLCYDSAETYTIAVGQHSIQPQIVEDVPKILAVSDIHGEYEYFVDILLKGGVIDDAHNWAWGNGHLVVVGDVFDRGDKVTECLWLIYKLEQQAKPHGGRVHFILGNHELMVLQGDNRYIHERYLKGIARKSRIKHEDLFGPDSELGQWLRTRHTVVKLNDILYVHGGIAPLFADSGWSISHINKVVREKIGLRSSQIAFDDTAKLLFGSKGPFWYRGYHYPMENRYQQATNADVQALLNHYQASTIIVGHTDNGNMVSLYGGRIYGIDVDFHELRSLQALLWQDGKFSLINGEGQAESID